MSSWVWSARLSVVYQVVHLPVPFLPLVRQGDERRVQASYQSVRLVVSRLRPALSGGNLGGHAVYGGYAGARLPRRQPLDQALELGRQPATATSVAAGPVEEPGESALIVFFVAITYAIVFESGFDPQAGPPSGPAGVLAPPSCCSCSA